MGKRSVYEKMASQYGCRPLWSVRFCWVLIVVWILAVDVLNVQAQSQELPEYAVEAAFIYKFTKFVDWPAHSFADPKEPFSICVLGKDPFGNILEQTFMGKTVNGREWIVKRPNSVEEMIKCHILFIRSAAEQRL